MQNQKKDTQMKNMKFKYMIMSSIMDTHFLNFSKPFQGGLTQWQE